MPKALFRLTHTARALHAETKSPGRSYITLHPMTLSELMVSGGSAHSAHTLHPVWTLFRV